ncbi:MAG: DUF515 domain-containing protein [Methanobacteriales archaeon]|nr:DUF515 domain-containing protein [Methanobacteriales archaeon]MBC7118660.1 DUF515 domain-containing protein [Methanobacteriaceae archaeon]
MIDKIKGNNNKPPDLRKKGDDNDIMKRVKGLVDKLTGTRKEPSKKPGKRPMPRPRLRVGKKEEKPRLKPPKKPPERKLGLTPPGKPPSRGMRPKIPEEDQRTLVGAIVFGIIIIIIVASGYYFLVYQPYQQTLQAAKDQKIAEVDAYFKGPLATDPQKQAILAEIDSGQTPEEVLAVDVLGPATKSWRRYQTQEINTKKDKFNRVMVVYNVTENGNQSESKRVIMKASDAQKIVNEADATVLANMVIQTPDTVAVPIMISRLQAAGGLIGVGSMVDVYLNVNQTGNNTTVTSQETTPRISGATVLAILRAKDSGSVDASILRSQNISVNTMTSGMSMEKKTTTDVEQLLRAAAAGGLSEEDIRAILQNYGIRLSDYERAANLGELDATYLVILEVPRDDVPFLIQNMNSIILTVPTQNAPEWMIRELHKIYG